MNVLENVKKLDRALHAAGYSEQANWLKFCINQSEVTWIAVVGDYATGKSTLINKLIGRNVLKTSVIPTENKITVRKGEADTIISENQESVPIDFFDDFLEDDKAISIEVNSEKLNGLEIIEFPGLVSKKSIENIQTIGELYLCDAVIMVISADHLLSETEGIFIENISNYLGEDKILVVINKLDLIAQTEMNRIINFAQKQMEQRYPHVKWCFLQEDILKDYSNVLSGVSVIEAYIKKVCESEKDLVNERTFNEIKKNIALFLNDEVQRINELSDTEIATRKVDEAKVEQEKSVEKTRLENVLLELKGRKNASIDKIDEYLTTVFNKMESSIIKKFELESDKYSWYKEQLPEVWNKDLKIVSAKADDFVVKCIEEDIQWMNSMSLVKSESINTVTSFVSGELQNSYTGKNYDTVKKILPIGIGGSVVIGFCLFRIVGASICLGGGVLFNCYIGYLDQQQNSEIRESISSNISKISRDARTIAKEELADIYEKIEEEFSKNIDEYLKEKYVFESTETDYSDMLCKISEAMSLLQ